MIGISHRFVFLLSLVLASLCPLRAADVLTEQECQKFGREFAKLCRQRIVIDLNALMNYEGLIDNTLNGLELDEAQKKRSRDDYNNQYANTWPQTMKLDERRTFYYAGTITYDNRQCVVLDWAKGINCDLYLIAVARAAEGKPRCTDIYNVDAATWESEVRRNQILMRLPKEVLLRQPANILRHLKITSTLQNSPALRATSRLDAPTDKRDEAIEQIEKYSENSRSQKPVLRLAAILYASVFNKEKFSEVIAQWKKRYPQDLSANFHAYRGYLQLADQAAATLELQELKKKAGNNPFLLFLLGCHAYELGNLAEAKKAAIAATMEGVHCDKIIYDWDLLMKISAKAKDYSETVRILDAIAKAFPSIPIRAMIDTQADFEEFRQSNEYKQWTTQAKLKHY